MDLPLALSVHRFVTSVGAYAGFAALIGLAILVLLFFAQARETSALRDHADELLERIGGLESRLSRQAAQAAQAAQNASAQQATAAPAAAGAQLPSAASELAALELAPFPPAGVGAPALSAATHVVPAGVMVGASAARSAVAVGNGPGPATASPTLPGSNGSSHPGAPVPVGAGPITGDSANRSAPGPTRPATAAAGARPVNSAARRPPARPAAPVRQGGRGRRGLLIGLIVAAVVIVGAVAAGVALSSSGSHKAAATTSTTRSASASANASRLAAVNPHTVTVAVLNGTATAGLAHRTAQRLAGDGFQDGKIMTASDQTRTSTTVAYIPGARTQALAVAKALNLGAASVAPVDAGTREVACQGLPTCTASVFVTVGADLAKQ